MIKDRSFKEKELMKTPTKILYVGTAVADGARAGTLQSDDGRLNLTLSKPKAMGGDDGPGTNPEQLLAGAYATCFLGAMHYVAAKKRIQLSSDIKVTVKVGVGPIDYGFNFDVDIHVEGIGFDRAQTDELLHDSHRACPFSNATRDQIAVRITGN